MVEEWTSVKVPEEPFEETEEGMDSARFMEALVRVTAAGFAGALVGLSRQNAAAGAKLFQRSVLHNSNNAAKQIGGKRKLPPTAAKSLRSTQSETNLPLQWAASFGAFVSILETSRFWSPSTIAINHYYDENNDDTNLAEEKLSVGYDDASTQKQQQQPTTDKTQDAPLSLESRDSLSVVVLSVSEQQRKSLATIMDYTLGGAVAGLAGGSTKTRPPPTSSSTSQLQLPSAILKSGRKSILLSGIGTGVILGFFAGVCQAGLEIAEDYAQAEVALQDEEAALLKQQRREEHELQQKKEEEAEQVDTA